MFDYMDRMIIVSLFPYLQQDMGLTDAQCGLLMSSVYWSILIFSFPVSILVDRWSRTKSISIMAAFWSMATLACAFTKTFSHLLIARTAIGIGIGGFVAHNFGWRHAFGLVAIPGLILAIIFYFAKDYKTIQLTKKEKTGKETKMLFIDMARQFTHNKTLIYNNLAFTLNVFITTSLLTWLPTYFHRFNDLAMDKASMKASSIMVLAIIGAPLGGFLSDLWSKKRETARLLFPALSSILTGILLFIAFAFLHGSVQYIVLLSIGITAVAFVPSGVAVTQDVVHPGLCAVSLSLNIIIQHLLGSSLAPIVIGQLSDTYGLDKALTILPIFAFLAGVLLFIGSFYYKKDLYNEITMP